MTPKDKAKEIIEKFRPHAQYWDCYNDEPLKYQHDKKLALIMVDEILSTCPQRENEVLGISKGIEYWMQVRLYIKQL